MTVNVQRPRCPYCHEDVVPGEGRGCAECMGWTHDECWEDHGKCPACGAAESLPPGTRHREAPGSAESADEAATQRVSNIILAGLFLVVLGGTFASLVATLMQD